MLNTRTYLAINFLIGTVNAVLVYWAGAPTWVAFIVLIATVQAENICDAINRVGYR